jgi:gag-polypeptide of LTR copia-type
MVTVELRWRIGNTRCGEDEDLRAHFEKLSEMRENLESLGSPLSDLDYAYTLLRSLPPSYKSTMHALNASADFTKSLIMPSNVIRLTLDEYDSRNENKPKEDADEAFATSQQKQKGKDKKKKHDIECHNCKKRGHVKAECWAKGGGKEGQGPKKTGNNSSAAGTTSANASGATTVAAEGDIEAWAVIEEMLEESVVAASVPRTVPQDAELYDSGATNHMSPFREKFTTYREIPPRAIIAADKRVFYTVGIGDLRIEVPHGKSFTPIILREALHTPDMAMTSVATARAGLFR